MNEDLDPVDFCMYLYNFNDNFCLVENLSFQFGQ